MESEGLLPIPTDAPTLPVGSLVGRCRVMKLLAVGGQGAIYLAHHEGLDKNVALKVLPPALAIDDEFVRRFVREARAAARLEHPNIVQIYDAGSEKGLHYLVMQYVDGKDLQTILDKKGKGKAEVADALRITKRVALALHAAHKAGIVHRDVKPSNIMLTKQSKVMVTDFGLAREISATKSATITQGGFVMGTPDYLSPEQALGERTDERSDIYSLGATLYRMLAGQPPYPDGSPVTVMMKHAREHEEPKPLSTLNPEVTPAVEALVAKMMAKRSADRFPTMEAVAHAISLLHDPSAASPPSDATSILTRRGTWVFIAVALGLGALVFLLIGLLMLRAI